MTAGGYCRAVKSFGRGSSSQVYGACVRVCGEYLSKMRSILCPRPNETCSIVRRWDNFTKIFKKSSPIFQAVEKLSLPYKIFTSKLLEPIILSSSSTLNTLLLTFHFISSSLLLNCGSCFLFSFLSRFLDCSLHHISFVLAISCS